MAAAAEQPSQRPAQLAAPPHPEEAVAFLVHHITLVISQLSAIAWYYLYLSE
jgi:hypothetical protein